MTTLIPVSRARRPARRPRRRGRSAAPGRRRAGTRTYLLLGLIAAVSAFPLYWSLVAASNDNGIGGELPPRCCPAATCGNLRGRTSRRTSAWPCSTR